MKDSLSLTQSQRETIRIYLKKFREYMKTPAYQ
jgi:hypothetical protein